MNATTEKNYDKIYHKRELALKAKKDSDYLFSIEGFSTFKLYPNISSIIEEITSNKHFCSAEFISQDSPVKFFLDIETNEEAEHPPFQRYVQNIYDFFRQRNYTTIFLKAHRGTKLSYHVISPSLVFRNVKDLRKYIYQNPTLVNEKFLDNTVYNNNRVFKTINSCKPGESEESRMRLDINLSNSSSIEDTIITYIPPNTPFQEVIDIEREITYTIDIPKEIDDMPIEIVRFINNNYGRNIEQMEVLNRNGSITIKCLLEIGVCPIAGKIHHHTFGHRQSVFILSNCAFLRCEDQKECKGEFNKITDGKKLHKNIKSIIANYSLSVQPIKEMNLSPKVMEILREDYCSIFEENPEKVEFSMNDHGITGNGDSCIHSFLRDEKIYNAVDKFTGIKMNKKPIRCNTIQRIYLNQNNITNNNHYLPLEDELLGLQLTIPPEVYNDTEIDECIKEILLHQNETYMAKLSKKDYYIYNSNKLWYYYDGKSWKILDYSIIRTKIKSCVIKYLKILKSYSPLLKDLEKKLCEKSIRELEKCKNSGNLNIACEDELLNPDFFKKLNSITGLLPYNNTVYNFREKKFIPHNKDLLNTYCLPIDRIDHIDTTEVDNCFSLIFPVKEERDYFLWSISRIRNDRNSNDNIFFLLGNGANGKSKMINFLANYFGDFATSIKSSVLTGKDEADPNAATNWLIPMVGRRFLYTSEFNRCKSQINSARIKQLSGGEKIACRANYGEEINVEIVGTIFISCNSIPEFNGEIDGGLERRIKIISFRSKFSNGEVNEESLIFKADKDIEDKIKSISWLQQLDHILDRYNDIDYLPQPKGTKENLECEKSRRIDDETEELYGFLDTIIEYRIGEKLNRTSLLGKIQERYPGKYNDNISQGKFYNNIFPLYLRLKYPNKNIDYESHRFSLNMVRFFGWNNFRIIE